MVAVKKLLRELGKDIQPICADFGIVVFVICIWATLWFYSFAVGIEIWEGLVCVLATLSVVIVA